MIAIQTTGLTKEYGLKPALKNLDLSIKQGEVYGFIGRNGAGKTTTINMILSLIHPTSGSIQVNEKPVSFSDPSYKNVIGFVPDVPVFPGYMNAREYIRYACDMYSIPKEEIKKRTDDVLAFVELSDPKKNISAYSRGMKQRLAIAQALVHDPDIIIMDEPTSALDPIGRKDVMNIILKLKGQKTIFYSTHILEDVEKVCDRIGLLDHGVLLLESSIEDIQKNYYQNDMVITTEESSEVVYQLVEKQSFTNNVRQHPQGIICALNGETTAQQILEFLLQEGIHIKEYKRLNATLEDVFIKVTNEATT